LRNKKIDFFLKDLNHALKLILYHNNIEIDYKNFTTILSIRLFGGLLFMITIAWRK
jgi:hypothetical protein